MNEIFEPCPFCGGKAKAYMAHREMELTLWVECQKCGAKTIGYYPNDDVEDFERCKELAIKAWNKRVSEN